MKNVFETYVYSRIFQIFIVSTITLTIFDAIILKEKYVERNIEKYRIVAMKAFNTQIKLLLTIK